MLCVLNRRDVKCVYSFAGTAIVKAFSHIIKMKSVLHSSGGQKSNISKVLGVTWFVGQEYNSALNHGVFIT